MALKWGDGVAKSPDYAKERYKWLKAHGVCVQCGQQDAAPGRTRCLVCADKKNQGSIRYHYEHREDLLVKKRVRSKALREERKAAGLCPICGKRKPKQGRVNCPYCTARINKKGEIRRRKAGVMPRYMMGNGEYCFRCGKPSYGEKLCPSCMESSRQTIKLASAAIDRKNHIWNAVSHAEAMQFYNNRR